MASAAYNPPLPPNVQQQVGTPMQQFVAMGGPVGAAPGQFDPNAFLVDRMGQVAALLKEVGQVVSTTKPGLMPILKVMLEAGSSLVSEIQPENSPSPDGAAIQPQMAQPNSGVGALSMG